MLLLAKEAVKKREGKSFVFVKLDGENKPSRQEIVTGIEDDNNVEVVSGLNADDSVVIMTAKPKGNRAGGSKSMSSPFMPSAPAGGRGGR